MKIELNKEQIDLISMQIKKAQADMDRNKKIGNRLFGKYSKILFILTGKNEHKQKKYITKN